jgi:hypothetical protein
VEPTAGEPTAEEPTAGEPTAGELAVAVAAGPLEVQLVHSETSWKCGSLKEKGSGLRVHHEVRSPSGPQLLLYFLI